MNTFNVLTMPGGEQHATYTEDLKQLPINPVVSVSGIVTADKLIAAGMQLDVFRRAGKRPILYLPYLPGARQDRVTLPEVGLSCKVYAKLVKSFRPYMVIAVDPHSEAAENIWREHVSLIVVNHHSWFLRWIEKQKFVPGLHKFLFPDKGAAERYIHPSYSPARACSKRRDSKTGALSGFEVPDLRDWKDNFIWIVDDICDGGGTFIAIAKEVRAQLKRNCSLGLAVSHGIFSKGIGDLYTYFDTVVATDSVYEGQFGKFIQIQPLAPVVLETEGININA